MKTKISVLLQKKLKNCEKSDNLALFLAFGVFLPYNTFVQKQKRDSSIVDALQAVLKCI